MCNLSRFFSPDLSERNTHESGCAPLGALECGSCRRTLTYSHTGALRNCNVKKTRRELSRWELRNRATRADTLSKRAVHVQPPQLSTACLRRPQHELREQRQHCTSSSTQIEPSMWAMTSTAVNACGVVLRRIGHRGRPCSWRGGGGGESPFSSGHLIKKPRRGVRAGRDSC